MWNHFLWIFFNLYQLNEKIREKRPVNFYQDNVPAHQNFLTLAELKELKYQLLEHPTYSLDFYHSSWETWNNSFMESVFHRIKRLFLSWNGIWQSVQNITKMVSDYLIIVIVNWSWGRLHWIKVQIHSKVNILSFLLSVFFNQCLIVPVLTW